MPASLETSRASIRTALRPAPSLAPEDSLYRFIQTARFQTAPELPVVERGRLIGMVSMDDILPILAIANEEERERALLGPIGALVRPARAVARPDMNLTEVAALCAEFRMPLIPVADDDETCCGIIYASDLLVPDMPPPRPSPVGGMATPFGVYLTNGSLQAGVGNVALFASGVYTGLLFIAAGWLFHGALSAAQMYLRLPGTLVENLTLEGDAHDLHGAFIAFGGRLAGILIFLTLMRLTRITGFHAAEHQTVHAMERNEPLVPEVVGRMPRPHPRCGTNIMAAFMIFFGVNGLLSAVPDVGDVSVLFAAIVTLFTWRNLGTVLQAKFTTRPASQRELESGIRAGKSLMEKYLTSPPRRPPFLRRIWCMGLLQTMAGMIAVTALAGWLASLAGVPLS